MTEDAPLLEQNGLKINYKITFTTLSFQIVGNLLKKRYSRQQNFPHNWGYLITTLVCELVLLTVQ